MKTREEILFEAVLPYKPEKSRDDQLADDWRIVGSWYSTLKRTGEHKYTENEILYKFTVPLLTEILKRGKQEFHPKNWKDLPRELYLKAFKELVKKGIYLTEPHGQMVEEGTKKAIVKAKKFIVGNFNVLVSGNKAYGFIRLKEPKQIDLENFEELRKSHQVSEQERLAWWKDKEKLYFYEIRDFIPLEEPQEVSVPKDVQIFIPEVRLKEEELEEGIRPAFGSPGGKRFLAKTIVSYIPEHKTYVEPFAGGGAVLFNKKKSEREIINDADPELIATYKFLRNANESEKENFNRLNWTISQSGWEKIKNSKPKNLMERAHKFLYVRTGSFGNAETSFSPSLQDNGRKIHVPNRIESIQERIKDTEVSNKDWIESIQENNSKDTFIYLDPPYPSGFSGKVFGDITNESLERGLRNIKAKWMLSLKDLPEVRKVFKNYNTKVVETLRVMNTDGKRENDKELLISNFSLQKTHLYEATENELEEGVRAAFGSPGGKRLLSKTIIPYIPEHKTYLELFAGGAAVFFAKKPSEVEVLNDFDKQIYNAYITLRDKNPDDILIASERKDWVSSEDKVRRAWENREDGISGFLEYMYGLRGSFSQARKTLSRTKIGTSLKPSFSNIKELHERLSKVKIYSADYKKWVEKYDAKDSFFYLDPPYPGEWARNIKATGFDLEEFAGLLENLKGKFIVSMNTENKKFFADKGWHFKEVERITYFTRPDQQKDPYHRSYDTELLIANFPLKKVHLYEADDFQIEEWTPEVITKWTDTELNAKYKELFGIWEERGSRKNDELVINANQFLTLELRKRKIDFEKTELDDLSTYAYPGIKAGFLDEWVESVTKNLQDIGPVVWIPDFVSWSGSGLYANERLPKDADWIVRSKEIDSSLGIKLARISKDVLGENAHLVPSPFGPNWRWMGLYDLVLMPKGKSEVHEVDKSGFQKRFYESEKGEFDLVLQPKANSILKETIWENLLTDESLLEQMPRAAGKEVTAEAKQSVNEDKIKPFRFFIMQKPTKGAKPNQRMTVESFTELFHPDDFLVYSSKKYDGMAVKIDSDGKGRVEIWSEDGEQIDDRMPKTVAEIKEIKKAFIVAGEVEEWKNGDHQPREAVAGYIHAKTPPDDSNLVTNLFTCLSFDDEKDLHKRGEDIRQEFLDKLKIKQSTWGVPNMKFRLNKAPNLTSRNIDELKKHTEFVRRQVASEGNVAKKVKSRYWLDGNSRGGWAKFHNNALLFGIVIERLPTKVKTIFNYRYGIDPEKYSVKAGDLAEVKGNDYLEVGKSFNTNEKKERGDIIAIEFETFNFIKDEEKDTISVSAWAPRYIPLKNTGEKIPTQPDTLSAVLQKAKRERVLQEKRITKDGETIYEQVEGIEGEIDYCANIVDYLKLMNESFGIDPNEIVSFLEAEKFLKEAEFENIQEKGLPIALQELFKPSPENYPKNYGVLINHYRGKSLHTDFRRKQNGFLMGETLFNAPKGLITEPVDTLTDAKKWDKILWGKSKFRPDMSPREKILLTPKAKQPLAWLNIRNNIIEPGSVGATRFEPGVFTLWDDGMVYPGVQKPYFKEFFLDMKKFKGRMVERLIGVGEAWEKPPKGAVTWEAWTNMVDQTPYLMTRRARTKKDYIPKEGEKAIPPEWEKKIKTEFRWWTKGLKSKDRMNRLQLAYNDLIEKKVLKGRLLESSEIRIMESKANFILRHRWWMGPAVVRAMPVSHWDLVIDSGKTYLDEWNLEKNPLFEEEVNAFRKKVSGKTPFGESFRKWMGFEGPIAPDKGTSKKWAYEKVKIIKKVDSKFIVEDKTGNQTETKNTIMKVFKVGDEVWIDPRQNIYQAIEIKGEPVGNPNAILPAFMEIIDEGEVEWIEDSPLFSSFIFKGKKLKGYWSMKQESQDMPLAVFSKSALPGEKRKEVKENEEEKEYIISSQLSSPMSA